LVRQRGLAEEDVREIFGLNAFRFFSRVLQ
jgi:microsomal dipeptidase-like Zn-dependent dipeptidase